MQKRPRGAYLFTDVASPFYHTVHHPDSAVTAACRECTAARLVLVELGETSDRGDNVGALHCGTRGAGISDKKGWNGVNFNGQRRDIKKQPFSSERSSDTLCRYF
jgi:hypothetical protein